MKYNLEKIDKNAICVIGYVTHAMRECGEDKHDIYAYTIEALRSTWDHLWRVSEEVIDKLNNKCVPEDTRLIEWFNGE